MSKSSDLPEGWLEVEFGELFTRPGDDVVDGPFGSNLRANEYVPTGIPIARLQNIDRNRFVLKNIQFVTVEKAEELARHTFVPGDILITKLGDPLGKACLAPSSIQLGVLVADVVRARITHSWVDANFLCYQINSENIVDQFKEQTKGTTRPRVNLTKIRSLKTRLCPRAEQNSIVARLDELLSGLDAGVAELNAAQKKLQQYRRSLLKAAVEGALTVPWREAQSKLGAPAETGAQLLKRILTERRARWKANQLAKFMEQGKTPPKGWQKKYPEPVQPETTDLPALPKRWVWASVEQLGNVQLGRQRSPDKMKGISPARYIRAANITEDGIDLADVLEMDFSEQERRVFALHAGDVLLTEASGSAEHVGRPAIWPSVDGLYCFQNTVLRFQPDGVSSEFAFYSYLAMQKLGVFSKLSGGVGINHLSAGKFSKLPVALPSRDEQAEIVKTLMAKLEAVDDQRLAIELSLKRSAAQRQNILRAAFAGELVSQDPNNEPATVLLERIRAEQVERDKQPKVRKNKLPKEIAAVVSKLIDVLAEAGDWVPAQEAFRRCGIADGASTERIEGLYSELRQLDKVGRLSSEPVFELDKKTGKKVKTGDRLKLVIG